MNSPIHQTSPESYEGNIRLVVPSSVDLKQITQFEKLLKNVENIRIVLIGGSVEEGTVIIVEVPKSLDLSRTLREMPMVDKVYRTGKEFTLTLKTDTSS